MKNSFLITSFILVLGGFQLPAQSSLSSNRDLMPSNTILNDSLLRHVVLFKFNQDTPAEKIKEIEDAFAELQKKITQIAGYEWGLNNSPEGLNQGFTHCFVLTFKTEEDRDTYLPHPDHKEFGRLLGPYLADVLVVDYWTH